MATQVKIRRGSAVEHDSFTGAVGELTYDTTNKAIRAHDGITTGGVSAEIKSTFSSIEDIKSKSVPLIIGQVVSTPMTKWQVVSGPTYTLPYATRTRTFNALSVGNGKYLVPCGDSIFASDFLDDGVDVNNDLAVGEIASVMRDGLKLDFSGKMFRVYANTVGIPSSSATPATDRAQLLTEMLFLDDLEDISFGKGGLYAANQGRTGTKSYFPSTLYLKACEGVHFERGSIFESKGESWGDADASVSLSSEERQDFLGQNGGHAIVTCRCKTITGSPTTRLAGSVGSLYFSSTQDIRLTDPFSNSASLGYASYAFDAWVGGVATTGLDNYHGNISNPQAWAETILRREDGVQAGSSIYCGKGGVITEDADVRIATQGGYIADMYGNGTAKTLGYAFGAGVYSLCTNVGAIVRNCQEVIYVNVSANGTAECRVSDVDAVVGLTGVMIGSATFGACVAELRGKVRVNDSRVWDGETAELANTSLVANLKGVSYATVTLDCDAKADANPPSGAEGGIFSLISNSKACYGGVTLKGGDYVTSGNLLRSSGWGGSKGETVGLVIKAGVSITDVNQVASDGYIVYTNKDASNVFTYIYHDYSKATFVFKGLFRSLSAYDIQGTDLVTKIKSPQKLDGAYVNASVYRDKDIISLEYSGNDGLSGPYTLSRFVVNDNTGAAKFGFVTTDAGSQVQSVGSQISVSGPQRTTMLLRGDVRDSFTVGNSYNYVGG